MKSDIRCLVEHRESVRLTELVPHAYLRPVNFPFIGSIGREGEYVGGLLTLRSRVQETAWRSILSNDGLDQRIQFAPKKRDINSQINPSACVE